MSSGCIILTAHKSMLTNLAGAGVQFQVTRVFSRVSLHGYGWSNYWADAGRNWGQEEKRTTEDEIAGWHHRLDGHEWINSGSWWWTGRPGVLQFMGLQSETQLRDWTELNHFLVYNSIFLIHLCSGGSISINLEWIRNFWVSPIIRIFQFSKILWLKSTPFSSPTFCSHWCWDSRIPVLNPYYQLWKQCMGLALRS